MSTLEPAQALFACENALRTLFAHAYSVAYGPSWLEKVSTNVQRQKWTERREAELHRIDKGLAGVPASGLAYSEFYELVTIADKHWEPLSPALGKKSSAMPLLRRFASLRNPVGHTRPLYAYEQDLYSGIAGTIRNQVTIYMSTHDDAGEYYPRIDAAWDSFGNRIEGSLDAGELAGSHRSDLILRPGDLVSFTVVATDPQDRKVEWDLHADGSPVETKIAKSGAETTFAWQVTDGSVKERSVAHFYMRVQNSPYHRAHGFDHRVFFTYTVRPPLFG